VLLFHLVAFYGGHGCAFSSFHCPLIVASSHIAIVVMVCVLFVATNIEPPYVFTHVYVYDGTVSVVATLDMIKVAAIASSMVHGGNKYELYHCDAARGK
jgi:hypothetical protein